MERDGDNLAINPQEEEVWMLARIRTGDIRVFELLFRTHYPGLCTFTKGYVKSIDVSEDIVQDVFVRIWQNHSQLFPKGSIQSYLYKACRNRALNYLKHFEYERGWFDEAVFLPDVALDPLQVLTHQELDTRIQRAIEKLPPGARTIFKLSRENDLTYSEIAEVLDISVKTVETQMGRALKFMRDSLREYIEFKRRRE